MWVMRVSILIALLSICSGQNEEARIVTITQGPVRGYRDTNSEVFQYFGIPYATAPTGADKFKAPLPAPTWSDTFEATQNNIACPMNQMFPTPYESREDCLIANVFTPSTQESNLPVVVFVHGGAYNLGASSDMSPKPLVESQRVVAVTINYRLGVHGFLCLGTEDVPGNGGLRDVLAGLRWVRENIASFGGNPNDITLAGSSAGGSITDLMSLSNTVEGLINKVIVDSAANVAAWSVQPDPIKNAQDFARKLDFNNVGNLTALEDFYKSLSYAELTSDLSILSNHNSDLAFVPCIENDLGQEIILHDSPVNIIKSGNYPKLPVLYSFANMEGIFRMRFFDEWAPIMNQDIAGFLVHDLAFEDDSEKEAVAQSVKEFYFGNNPVGLYTLFDYINYFTDAMFAYPVLRSVKLQAEAGHERIYLEKYQFYNRYPPVPGVPDVLVNFPGASHASQTDAVLELRSETWIQINFTEEYRQLRVLMRELWINFITTGTPSPAGSSFPAWPAANASRSPHMIIGDTIELGGPLNEARAQFWDNLYERYYRDPIPPLFVEFEDENNNAGNRSGNIIVNMIFICIIFVTRY